MYAVIRAGGKQYRVAPGDVIRLESQGNGTDGKIEFTDVLAVSGEPGQIGRPQSAAVVTGEVVEQGRGAKILVFHYKRKKQYKKLRGHRQGYTAVRITEIAIDGQKFTAPELPKKEVKVKKLKPAEVDQRKRRRRKSSAGVSSAVGRASCPPQSGLTANGKLETKNWKPEYGTQKRFRQFTQRSRLERAAVRL